MTTRLLCICSLLLLQFVSAAFGEGTYQRTKDGKTIVWNDDPKPGDTATWFGDRDSDGYATKVGTLTWYTARGTVYARFRGNMVRGKFNGMVNGYSKGRTGHAAFVAGQRTTGWVAGTAPAFNVAQTPPAKTAEKIAKAESTEPRNLSPAAGGSRPSPTNRERDESASEKLTRQVAPEDAREKTRQPVFTVEPAPLRENQTPNVSEQASQAPSQNAAANEVPPPQTPPAETHQPVVAVNPVAPGENPTPNAGPIPEQESEPPSQNAAANEPSSEPPAPAAEKASTGDDLKRAEPEAPAEGPRVVTTEKTPAPAGPSSVDRQATEDKPPAVSPAPEEAVANRPATGEAKVETDNSVQSESHFPAEGGAPSPPPVSKSAASPQANPRLTSDQVVKIANTEVRRRGYNRADYRREEPQFKVDYQTWSVSYDPMTADGTEGAGEHFSVIIDDRTRGAIFMLRK